MYIIHACRKDPEAMENINLLEDRSWEIYIGTTRL